jgi:hypothetical protein
MPKMCFATFGGLVYIYCIAEPEITATAVNHCVATATIFATAEISFLFD